MADSNTTSITLSLHDELSNFLGEVTAIADLLMASAHSTGFEIDDETILNVAQAQYYRARDLRKKLDGGEQSGCSISEARAED